MNIVLKGGGHLAAVRINLVLKDAPLSEVLRYVAALAGAEIKREPFAFVVSPKQEVQAAPKHDAPKAPAPAQPAGAALKKATAIILPKLDLRDATLSEALDFLRAKSAALDPVKKGVNLVLMPAAKGDSAQITLSLSGVPLSEALRYIAALAGYEITADEHVITLRPPAK